jgi:group I intron endonuclease
MADGIIYLIRNSISHNCYVGLTTKLLEERWKQHISCALRGDEKPLYYAIRKYGVSAFEVSILEVDPQDSLCEAEQKWIEEIGSFKKGYNLTIGGNGFVGERTEEMRRRTSESLMGHSTSDETKQKISNALKGKKLPQSVKDKIKVGLAKPECILKRRESSTGKVHSQEAKAKISDSSKKLWANEEHKKEMSERHRGSGNSRAHLTEEDVTRIRKEWCEGGDPKRPLSKETCKMYAEQTGSTSAAIFRMIRGHSWKHLL